MKAPNLCSCLCVVLVLSLAGEGDAALRFLWTPPSVDLTLRPGASADFTCTVVNEGESALKFAFYPTEVAQTAEGTYRVLEDKAVHPSCKQWITVAPSPLELAPKRSADIVCTVAVPRDADAGGRYAAVCCELLPEQEPQPELPEERRARFQLRWRSVTVVLVAVEGRPVRKSLRIASLEAKLGDARRGERLTVSALLENDGEVHAFAQGRLAIRAENGRIVREVPLGRGRGGVLPGAAVKFTSILKRYLPPGLYTLEATFDYGARALERARIPVTLGKTIATGQLEQSGPTFSVAPAHCELATRSPAFRAVAISVRNLGARPLAARARLVDLQNDLDGRLVPAKETADATSCASWLTISPATVEIPPGRTKQIRLSVNVPPGQSGGRCAGLLVTGETAGGEEEQLVPLLLTAGSAPQPEARIEAVRLLAPASADLPERIAVTLRNVGSFHLRPKRGSILIRRKASPTELLTDRLEW